MKDKDNNHEDSLGFLFGEISRLHHSRAHNFFSEKGLHRGQHRILFMLWQADGVTQREMADRLNLAPASITDALQRMEKRGFIERRSDLQDQRITRVYLTELGRGLQLETDNVFKSFGEQSFKGFTLEEKVLLRRFFIQIRENLKNPENE
jgi:DNA-binding MarR family transcriptional regulator